MGLTDLLWACPRCGERWSSRQPRGRARCGGCRHVYRRGRGGSIEEVGPAGAVTQYDPCDLVDRLPPIQPARGDEPVEWHRARARLAPAAGFEPVHYEGRFLGRFERRGSWRPGELMLTASLLRFLPDDAPAEPLVWPLERLTAVQASSRTLQVKARGQPVVSIRFDDASCRHWEQSLVATLRHFYRQQGWGEIREFQPRIIASAGSP